MARTFVRVELLEQDDVPSFGVAMGRVGFLQTVKGRKTRKAFRLPSGMYVIDKATPVEALELTREAARQTSVKARIFCMPVGGDVRFGNLQADSVVFET
jgi:NAD kinase